MKAEALFYLGQANYKLEKAQDAANFFRDCAAIKSRFQATAAKNLAAVKAQYRGIK
jgi:TolA-binding protein